jgi:nucleoside-diphosphate-sugar epimerase
MRVLVTGGAGFLGQRVVSKFRAEGFAVVSTDVFPRERDIESLDVTDLQATDAKFSSAKPDVVIHLAALTGAKGKGGGSESLRDPYDYFRTNVMGTLTVLEACRLHKIQRVIYMSSFSTYGVTEGAIDEKTNFNPTNPYGFSKACGELVAKCYASNYGIKTLIFRAPLLAGETQEEESALREFVLCAIKGRPIVIYGNGSHVREWLHPFDVAEAFLKGMTYFDSMAIPYDIFVLGGKPISMIELARLVIDKIGGRVQHEQNPGIVFDQYSDTRKARTLLGWQPSFQVHDIVDRVIADIRGEQKRSEKWG